MRTTKITYKDPNVTDEVTKIIIASETNKEVIAKIKELTSKGIYSINIRAIVPKEGLPVNTVEKVKITRHRKNKDEDTKYLNY